MGWNGDVWPAANPNFICISNYNDLIDALNERDAETYGGGPFATKAAGDWIEIGDIVNLRSRVENIIDYFVNPAADYAAYTKASCLTAAIGQADWSDPALAAGDWITPRHFNELKSVLSQLLWLPRSAGSFTAQKVSPSSGGSNTSWAAAWSTAKTTYAGGAWNNYATSARVGFQVASMSPYAGWTYYKNINHWRTSELPFVIPDYAVGVLDTKMLFNFNYESDGGSGDLDIDLYEEDDFGGAAIAIEVTAGGVYVVDVTTVTADTTVEYSYRTNPESPTPDDYNATDSNGSLRGVNLVSTPTLLVLPNWAHT